MSVSYHIRGVALDSDTGIITVSATLGGGALEGTRVQLKLELKKLPDHIKYLTCEHMLFTAIPKFVKEELST